MIFPNVTCHTIREPQKPQKPQIAVGININCGN
jgi:hypothetical protein